MDYEEIFLYGYNEISQKKYHLFEGNFIKCSIIDVKADNIDNNKIKMITPEKFFCNVENKNVLIIIMLSDALKHKKIYEMFVKEGYTNILYLPRLETINKDNAKTMLLYGDFLADNDYDVILNPNKVEYSVKNSVKENVFYRSSTRIVLLVQTKYIYSNTKLVNGAFEEYSDIPLRDVRPYFELWEYFDEKYDSIKLYENRIGIVQKKTYGSMSTEEILNNRKNLFDLFEYHYRKKDDFFRLSASTAKWNPQGYFNLEDGKHRASYLIYRQQETIPISLSIEDYDSYIKYISKIPLNMLL